MNIPKISSYKPFFSSSRQNNNFINFQLQNDIFVKNTNQTSLKGNDYNTQYDKFRREISNYIMSPKKLSLEEIEKIVEKYLPDTKVDSIENLQTSNNTSRAIAYIKIPVNFYVEEKEIVQGQKTIYLNLPQNLTRANRIQLLGSILHESTHAFQENTENKDSTFAFTNNWIKTHEYTDETINAILCSPRLFTTLEANLRLLEAFEQDFYELPTEIKNKNLTLDKACKKYFGKNASDIIADSIKNLLAEQKDIDIDYLLEYFKHKSRLEEEAYRNSLEKTKELLGIKNKTNCDITIEIYRKIILTCEKLQKQKLK